MRALQKGRYLKKAVIALACLSSALMVGYLWASESGSSTSDLIHPTNNRLDTAPPRGNPQLSLNRVSWDYDCMECHRSLKSKWKRDYELSEHRHIKLDHGNNRFCLNCHHPENREAFVDYDGSEISGNDTVALCSKCHGTLHQDWQAGAHGRKNGYWDTEKGEQTRLACSQCHDPHSPAFKPMHPLAPPTYPSRATGQLHEISNTEHHP